MAGRKLTDLKGIPENHASVVGPWLSFKDAVDLKGVPTPKNQKDAGPKDLGPDDKYVIFAVLGDWNAKKVDKETKLPEVDDNGMLKDRSAFLREQAQSVEAAKAMPGGIWDYAVYQPSNQTWVGANYGLAVATYFKDKQNMDKPQNFYTRTSDEIKNGFKEDLTGQQHKAVIYYAFLFTPKR
jgi:hypothetical protein